MASTVKTRQDLMVVVAKDGADGPGPRRRALLEAPAELDQSESPDHASGMAQF